MQETIAGSIVAGYYDLVTASPGTQADAIRIVETAASPNFFTLLEIRVNGEVSISPVHAGVDMITWSGQGVGLVPSYDFGYTPTSLAWSASPTTGVVFDPAGADPWTSTVETPTVTITKATDNPSTVNLTFTADDGGGPVVDTMRIYVYDDACLAAIVADPVAAIDVTDFDGNCITGLEDFAVAALAWFYDFSLTEPVAK